MIYINEQWRINADAYNWVLEKRRKIKERDEYSWSVVGFYPSLMATLLGYTERRSKSVAGNEDLMLSNVIDTLNIIKSEIVEEVRKLKITKEDMLAPANIEQNIEQNNNDNFDFLD